MSKLTNRFILFAAAVALPACAGATTTSSAAESAVSSVPAPTSSDHASAAVVVPAASSAPTVLTEPTASASTAARVPVDPDLDPDPVPGEVPDGVVPLERLDDPGEPAPPAPIEPFVRVPFAAPTTPVPINPEPELEPLALVAELQANTPAAGEPMFTAATGCGSHCITGGWIVHAGGPTASYDLTVVVDVTSGAEVEAFLTQAPIERNAEGRYVAPFSQPTSSGEASPDWAPGVAQWGTNFDLEPATTYHLLIRANDAQGSSAVAGTFTTAEAFGPNELATPSPCADGCLDIRVEAADDGRSLSLVVGSMVDVDAEFQWAQGPLVQTDDGPTLDDASTRSATVEAGVPSTLKLDGLTPFRSYSFIVVATDQFGGADRWVATVSTRSPLIWAGIDRVYISGDGDPGSKNDGEIGFSFGEPFDHWGYRQQEKISSNSTVRLGRESGSALEVDAFGRYPWIAVVASEQDGAMIGSCFVDSDPLADWLPDTIKECQGARWMRSIARVPSMTLEQIEQLPTCAGFDVGNPAADRCIRVETEPNSDQQVSFEMVVYFDLDPGA